MESQSIPAVNLLFSFKARVNSDSSTVNSMNVNDNWDVFQWMEISLDSIQIHFKSID
jgi:hypothetical protein